MKTALVFLLLVASLSSVMAVFKYTICQGDRKTISCPYGLRIYISSAYYGRTDKTTCAGKGKNVYTTECKSKITKQCAADYCDGKERCRLEALDNVYTDPCYGTHKYLYVEYRCKPADSAVYERVVCEGKDGSFGCLSGKVINIISAYYGRTDAHECPSKSVYTTSCKAPHAINKVKGYCQGKSKCTVWSNNGQFGDPCRGTYKYLRVKYTCVRPKGYY